MDQSETISVALSATNARDIQDRVEAGSYASADAVISAAMQALQRDEDDLVALKARIKAAADEKGPGYTSEEVFGAIRRRYLEQTSTGLHEDPARPLE